MSALPDWLEHAVAREKLHRGLHDGTRIELTAIYSARDLERIAEVTARTNCSWTAAIHLFGGGR